MLAMTAETGEPTAAPKNLLIVGAVVYRFLTTLFCHEKSVADALLRRADCLPSSLDSEAEERKYVSNILKTNGYTKAFLRNCQKPVHLVALLMKGNQWLILALFLHSGCYGTHQENFK